MAKTFLSLVVSGIGAYGYLALAKPYDFVGLLVAIGVMIGVLVRRERAVVLRFGRLTWTIEELCRHFLVSGSTGAGKTVSGIQPILVQVTRNVPNWGGLVLGVKGDEHAFITELAEAHGRSSDVIHLQVRPAKASTSWVPPHRYNLLSDRNLPWMTHAKIIVDVAASLTDGRQSSFFRSIAQLALANAFELLDQLGSPVTLTRAHQLLTSSNTMKAALDALAKLPPLQERLQLTEFFKSTYTNARAYEQREGIEGTIKTYIGWVLDEDVAAVFSSDEPNTFCLSDVDDGSILSVTMSQKFVMERRVIHSFLKTLFYYHALRRFDRPQSIRDDNLLLLVADEYQDIVTSSNDGASDHTMLDRVRAAKLAIIASVQSEVSLDPAIGKSKRKVIVLNMRSRMVFRASDMEGATASADHLGKRKAWKTSRNSGGVIGTSSLTKREEEEHIVKPSKLMLLPDHVAVVVHPSRGWSKKRMTPLDGRGQRLRWK